LIVGASILLGFSFLKLLSLTGNSRSESRIRFLHSNGRKRIVVPDDGAPADCSIVSGLSTGATRGEGTAKESLFVEVGELRWRRETPLSAAIL